MFCIAAFLVFAVLAIFSASYRPLVKQAWHCVLRRVTLKPCDINFAEEVKGRLIGKLVLTHPHVARFLNRWIDWLAFVFVVLSVWSTVYLLNAGLNLWVYDTCNPSSVESCSLSGEACGIDQSSISLVDAWNTGNLGQWALGPVTRFADTVSRIPDRLKHWEPSDYIPTTATTYLPEDPKKPEALEVLDPDCLYCRKLFGNMKDAGFERTHNLSYLLYPIPDQKKPSGFKFTHSLLIATYVEATKHMQLESNPSGVAPDWQLLEKVFSKRADGTDWQSIFNLSPSAADVSAQLEMFLGEIGFTPSQIAAIRRNTTSAEVQASLLEQKKIVEEKLRTLKIPTLLFGGRRYDRVVDIENLR